MPASPSWSRGRRSGTAVLSGEGREERCPILPGRRSGGESRPPSQRETRYSRCHYDSTPPFPSAAHSAPRRAQRGGRICPTHAREPARLVTQRVGSTDIAVSYNRPVARGRRLFGELVRWG